MNVRSSLLSHLMNEPFLDRVITGDEKWVLYKSVMRQRQWVGKRETLASQVEEGLHAPKMLLSVSWDMKYLVQFELSSPNQTIQISTASSISQP